VSLWEPFTQQARRAIVRAQEVAQMFASNYIGTEHIAFALAETDDDVGRVLTGAIDRDQMREQLGGARSFPNPEMVFTPGAKRTIEASFENARRLDHNYIGTAHLALGILASDDCPALRAGISAAAVRDELDRVASSQTAMYSAWSQTAGTEHPHPVTQALLSSLRHHPDLANVGTQVSVAITQPDGAAQSWTWTNVKGPST
jgi:ATP-dependent Clp protease ATP-binding subunit ClpC